jgi:hypothetical protein
MFSFICGYTPKTNAVILVDMKHIRGRNREKEGNQKLECG